MYQTLRSVGIFVLWLCLFCSLFYFVTVFCYCNFLLYLFVSVFCVYSQLVCIYVVICYVILCMLCTQGSAESQLYTEHCLNITITITLILQVITPCTEEGLAMQG